MVLILMKLKNFGEDFDYVEIPVKTVDEKRFLLLENQ